MTDANPNVGSYQKISIVSSREKSIGGIDFDNEDLTQNLVMQSDLSKERLFNLLLNYRALLHAHTNKRATSHSAPVIGLTPSNRFRKELP